MKQSRLKRTCARIFQAEESILILALLAICVVLSILSKNFLTKTNILNILRQVSMTAITGYGMAMLMLMGDIDLSVGSNQALVGIVAVTVLNATGSIFLSIASGLLFGALMGFLIGIITIKGHLTSFIVTLGMMSVVRGTSLVVTNAKSIQIAAGLEGFGKLGTGYFLGIPIPVLLMVILFVIFWYVLTNTAFGREIYAIGGNSEAAQLAGLSVNQKRMICFVISGIMTALSALILTGRVNSAQPNAGSGFEMKVISAVVLGGISMSGGSGKLPGAMVGMLILGVLSNGLTLLQVSSFWQDIISGAVTILAVFMDVKRSERTARRISMASMEEISQ